MKVTYFKFYWSNLTVRIICVRQCREYRKWLSSALFCFGYVQCWHKYLGKWLDEFKLLVDQIICVGGFIDKIELAFLCWIPKSLSQELDIV
jgi:hypothetical protein